MDEKKEIKLMLYFTLSYLVFFAVLAMFKANYEFLYYSLIMSVLVLIIAVYRKKMYLTTHILLGLTILGALNIFGGNVHILGTRLYDFYLIPGIFKYDNLVHSFGIFVVTFVIYSIVQPKITDKDNKFLLGFILISAAMGVGAYYEIIELGAASFLGASQQVGGYVNNALDQLFNFIGATVASLVIMYKRH